MIEIILIAISLSADACAVTASNTLVYKNNSNIKFLPIYFGVFQAIMPIIGYICGEAIIKKGEFITTFAPFVILSFIGVQMIINGLNTKEEETKGITHKMITLQALATSIDALAIGFSFAVGQFNIISTSAIIGIITFLLCSLTVLLIKKIKTTFFSRFEIIAGIVLIILGVKSII